MTTSFPNTLADLNDFRARAGMQPLKSWKESKAKLEEAINKLRPVMSEQFAQKVDVKPINDEREAATQRILDNKAKKAKKSIDIKDLTSDSHPIAAANKKSWDKVTKNTDDHAVRTVAEFCKDAGINPKIARAKLRKAGIKQVEGRWLATVAVRKVLEVNEK